MTSSNRVRVSVCRELTPGVTPVTPRMRIARITGESLQYNPEFVDSEELRDDRMMSDPILTMQSSSGGVNFEFSYPDDLSPLSEFIMSAFFNQWNNTPTRANDGVADSVITDVAAGGVITVAAGPAFAVGHLIRTSGFGAAQNNGVFRVTTGSATVPSVGAGLLAAETAPAATARVKVVGFEGVAGDITATASGLASTALDFTTLGLTVGQIVKIGGASAGSRFNFLTDQGVYSRVTGVTANALTLDNLPSTWAVDAGAGKAIRVYFGDTIKNGVLANSLTIERGFMGQAVPTYIVNRGMQANSLSMNVASRALISGSVDFTGMGGGQGTVTLDASPDPETSSPVMAANPNFQRLTDGGATMTGPNWVRSTEFTIANNIRQIEHLGSISPVDLIPGECSVSGKSDVYFGDQNTLQKFYTGTPTSIFFAAQKAGKAIALQFPRVTSTGGQNPSAQGKNQDVMLGLEWKASKDVLTQAHVLMDRFEFVD
jgi:hypothetical protein